MTTLGVGLDLVNTEVFAAQLADGASAFAEHTFTPAELRAARTGDATRDAHRLAARFAAKEAFVKAWSSARAGRPHLLAEVDLREVEVADDGFGRPVLRLHGRVAAALEHLAHEHGAPAAAHVSLTHEPPVAGAVVVLTCG